MNQQRHASPAMDVAGKCERPALREQRKMTQRSSDSGFAAAIFRLVAGTLFVTMSVAFVTIPYSLSMIPGDPAVQAAIGAPRHLS
jgi:hypothetical protein